MNFNNNYVHSTKPGYEHDNGQAASAAATEAFLAGKRQNYLNAKEENDGRPSRPPCESSNRMQKMFRSKRFVLAACLVVAVIVCLGVAGMFAFIAQLSHLVKLRSEIELLRAQNLALMNETKHLSNKVSSCEAELQKTNHLLNLSQTKCDLEKTNLTNHFQFEIRNIRAEKEAVERNLSECQREKASLIDQKTVLEANNEAQVSQLTRCSQEKNVLENQVGQQGRQLDQQGRKISELSSVKCSPCPSSTIYYGNSAVGLMTSCIGKISILIFAAVPSFCKYFCN